MPCTSRYNSVSIIVEKHKGKIKCFSVVGKGYDIKNQKSKIKNQKSYGITSQHFRFTYNWQYPQLFARFPICQKTPPEERVHFQKQLFRTAYRVYVWSRG